MSVADGELCPLTSMPEHVPFRDPCHQARQDGTPVAGLVWG